MCEGEALVHPRVQNGENSHCLSRARGIVAPGSFLWKSSKQSLGPLLFRIIQNLAASSCTRWSCQPRAEEDGLEKGTVHGKIPGSGRTEAGVKQEVCESHIQVQRVELCSRNTGKVACLRMCRNKNCRVELL